MPTSLFSRFGLSGFHLLALLFFFFPWVEVSCVKTKTADPQLRDAVEIKQSGLQMTYGAATKVVVEKDEVIETEVVDPKFKAQMILPYAVALAIGAIAGVIAVRRLRVPLALAASGAAVATMAGQVMAGFPIVKAAGVNGLWTEGSASVTLWFILSCACCIAAGGFAIRDALGIDDAIVGTTAVANGGGQTQSQWSPSAGSWSYSSP